MGQSSANYQYEHAYGDGNCAFNAFILGLSRPDVLAYITSQLDTIPQIDSFITQAAVALKLNLQSTTTLSRQDRWTQLTAKIKELHAADLEKNTVVLQTTLAPVMREMAIASLTGITAKSEAGKWLESSLLGAFDIQGQANLSHNLKDDIFLRPELSFIGEKFKELKASSKSIELQQNELIDWWWREGYQKFLNVVNKPTIFAGDIELAQLAKYFGVSLKVTKAGMKDFNVMPDYGVLDVNQSGLLTREVLEDLRNRSIVVRGEDDTNCYQYRIIMPDEKAVKVRMQSLPVTAYNAIEAYLKTCRDFVRKEPDYKGYDDNFEKLNSLLSGFASDIINELKERFIVADQSSVDRKQYRLSSEDYSQLLSRLSDVKNENVIFALYQKAVKNPPVISLYNTGGHWDHMLPITTPVPVVVTPVPTPVSSPVVPPRRSASAQPGIFTAAAPPPVSTKTTVTAVPAVSVPSVPAVPITPPTTPPTTPLATQLISSLPGKQLLSTESVDKIKKALPTDWKMDDAPKIDSTTNKPYRAVIDAAQKEQFQVHEDKMVTELNDRATYETMLKAFKAVHGESAKPKIATHSEAAKQELIALCKTIFTSPTIDWEKLVTVNSAAAPVPPSSPRP